MEGVYGRCWTAAAKESAYQRLNVGPDTGLNVGPDTGPAASMPEMGTLFNTGGLNPFPRLAEPPYVNLSKGFLFPTEPPPGPGPVSGLTLRPVSGLTFSPVFNNTFNRVNHANRFFNWSWVGDRVWKGVFSVNKPVPGVVGNLVTDRFQRSLSENRYTILKETPGKGEREYRPIPRVLLAPRVQSVWNSLLNPIVKNTFESSTRNTFGGKIKPVVLPNAPKTLQALFNRDSNINTDIRTTGPDILKPFQAAHHGKTDFARHIIQHMKQINDNTNNERRTVNRVDSLHKDIRVFSGNQERMMADISNRLTDMNRKIDSLQTQQKRTGPLIRSNPNSKDGGFYDY